MGFLDFIDSHFKISISLILSTTWRILLHLLSKTICLIACIISPGHLPIPWNTLLLAILTLLLLLPFTKVRITNAALPSLSLNISKTARPQLPDHLRVTPRQITLEQLLLQIAAELIDPVGESDDFHNVAEELACVETADRDQADMDHEQSPELRLEQQGFDPGRILLVLLYFAEIAEQIVPHLIEIMHHLPKHQYQVAAEEVCAVARDARHQNYCYVLV